MASKTAEFIVGIFIILAVLALMALAFNVSGLVVFGNSKSYILTAEFDNIGDLKPRAPVTIGGVKVGQVEKIQLDEQDFRARVTLLIKDKYNLIPIDTSAGILTQGLLGSNYISLSPGFEQQVLKPGERIETTQSAMILENLIGQLMYSLKNGDSKDEETPKQTLAT
ncbi:MAG: outer membrane lipid asymmetry maintenance protein MlaD [Coxiellaceae bacterium]|nr:outer membrane lipid asymmetry maintenance protein MlaD [Coxiellaceae bacterium]